MFARVGKRNKGTLPKMTRKEIFDLQKEFMKEHNPLLSVLRLLIADIKNKEIDKHSELTDDEEWYSGQIKDILDYFSFCVSEKILCKNYLKLFGKE